MPAAEKTSDGAQRSVITALGANAAIAAGKLVAALLTGSAGMLAEFFHSLADTGNQGLLLLGLRRARRPPDREHEFGHGQERFFWTFLVAVSMFGIGAAFAFYRGVATLIHPHTVEGVTIGFAVLAGAAIFEAYAWRTAWRQFSKRRTHSSLITALRESKDPEIITVLGEDTAALTGLALAASGLGLSAITGNAVFDALASLLIGSVLAAVALFLGWESKQLLIGEAVGQRRREGILRACRAVPGVEKVVRLLTMHLGPHDVLVTLEVEFRGGLRVEGIERATDDVENAIRQEVPEAKQIFVEAQTHARASRDEASG